MIPRIDALDSLPFPVLIGDIGGTNSRFALIAAVDSTVERMPDVNTADYPSIEDAIDAAVDKRTELRPRSAIIALAGPISGESVDLTNASWIVEPKKTIARYGLEEMILLNDFEAVALSLPGLSAADVDPIGSGTAVADGARVVIGPGTGLGAAALVRGRESWVPVPGEGGHINLGPVSPRDFAVWPHLERRDGRISGEVLLSGSGLVRLYKGICATDGVTPELVEPKQVSEAGTRGTNRQAAEALALFATYLGRIAGDLALIFMARGGVFLAGGIAAKIAPILKSGAFLAGFRDKAPHRHMVEAIPSAIITKRDPALAGIADYARAPKRFVVDLSGRRWRK